MQCLGATPIALLTPGWVGSFGEHRGEAGETERHQASSIATHLFQRLHVGIGWPIDSRGGREQT
jgi:hypothetical protein